jgi:hypothetical protein
VETCRNFSQHPSGMASHSPSVATRLNGDIASLTMRIMDGDAAQPSRVPGRGSTVPPRHRRRGLAAPGASAVVDAAVAEPGMVTNGG